MTERLADARQVLADRKKDLQEAKRTRSKKMKSLAAAAKRAEASVEEIREHVFRVNGTLRQLERDEAKQEEIMTAMHERNREATRDTLERVGTVEQELTDVRIQMEVSYSCA